MALKTLSQPLRVPLPAWDSPGSLLRTVGILLGALWESTARLPCCPLPCWPLLLAPMPVTITPMTSAHCPLPISN